MNTFDFEAEADRRKKQLDKLNKLVHAKKGKLANENFVKRAPEAVVQKERDSLAELESQQQAAKASVAALASTEDLEKLEKLNKDIAAKKAVLSVLNFFLGEGGTNGRDGM